MAIMRQDERGAVPHRGGVFDPMRQMRELMDWTSPLRELVGRAALPDFHPAFELSEKKDGFLLTADLPGVKESDLDVSVEGSRLTVSGKREAEHEEEGDTLYTYERSYGSFKRSFELPGQIDGEHVSAELDEGVLRVSIPKAGSSSRRRISLGRKKAKG